MRRDSRPYFDLPATLARCLRHAAASRLSSASCRFPDAGSPLWAQRCKQGGTDVSAPDILCVRP